MRPPIWNFVFNFGESPVFGNGGVAIRRTSGAAVLPPVASPHRACPLTGDTSWGNEAEKSGKSAKGDWRPRTRLRKIRRNNESTHFLYGCEIAGFSRHFAGG